MGNNIITEGQKNRDIKTLVEVVNNFKNGNDITVSLIQRKCKCGYFSASRVFEKLANNGTIIRDKYHPADVSE